jgi:hypothetical protein
LSLTSISVADGNASASSDIRDITLRKVSSINPTSLNVLYIVRNRGDDSSMSRENKRIEKVPGDWSIGPGGRRRQDLLAVPANACTWSGIKLRGKKKSTCRHHLLRVDGVRAAAKFQLRLRTKAMAAVRVGEGKQRDRAGLPVNTFAL